MLAFAMLQASGFAINVGPCMNARGAFVEIVLLISAVVKTAARLM